jgi:cytochrome c oxidase subunit 4
MASSAEEVKSSIKIYLFVFGALAVLTVVTVTAASLKLGVAAGIALALLIASIKGTLVASYFMHLIHERTALYWILGLCAVFFLAMVLLPVLQTSETIHLMDPIYERDRESHNVDVAPPVTAAGNAGGEHRAGP